MPMAPQAVVEIVLRRKEQPVAVDEDAVAVEVAARGRNEGHRLAAGGGESDRRRAGAAGEGDRPRPVRGQRETVAAVGQRASPDDEAVGIELRHGPRAVAGAAGAEIAAGGAGRGTRDDGPDECQRHRRGTAQEGAPFNLHGRRPVGSRHSTEWLIPRDEREKEDGRSVRLNGRRDPSGRDAAFASPAGRGEGSFAWRAEGEVSKRG